MKISRVIKRIFGLKMKDSQYRLSFFLRKIMALEEELKKAEDGLAKHLDDIDAECIKAKDKIDEKINELNTKKAILLDERDRAVDQISKDRNKIIEIRKKLFKED